jgi:NADH:ubiquinone oxidoreductase subunit E
MSKSTGNTVDEDISDIRKQISLEVWREIIRAWNDKKSLKQIAQASGVPIRIVSRVVKHAEKTFLEKEGRSHVHRSKF